MKFTTAVTLPEEICVKLILLSHEKAKGRKCERERDNNGRRKHKSINRKQFVR